MACYNCGGTDHWKDACPIAIRADSFGEHMTRIASFIDQWVDGAISVEQKRRWIGTENMQWYGPECPAKLRWPPFWSGPQRMSGTSSAAHSTHPATSPTTIPRHPDRL